MGIFDLFNASFLFSIAITIILLGCIINYFSYKLSEQDHKLTSMVNLVSLLAQDLQFVKTKMHNIQRPVETNLEYSSQLMGGQTTSELINVSDDDEDEEYEDVDDEEDDNDEEDDEEDDNDDDNEDEDEDDDNDDLELTKIITLEISPEEMDDNDPYEEAQNLDFDPVQDLADFEAEMTDLSEPNDIKILDMMYHTQQNTENQLEETNINLDELKPSEDFKSISITDLGDFDQSKTDYKKMSLNKLREVVVSKGIISDASKLKKNEILKMLGDE
jgi:hypothetical protein